MIYMPVDKTKISQGGIYLKDICVWNLSRGRKLEKVFCIAKWVFLALQCVVLAIRIILYNNGETNHTALIIIFWVFSYLFYGCFIAEMVIFSKNAKCEGMAIVKRKIETPQNMIKVITKIRGRNDVDVSMSGNVTLGQVATVAGIDFDNAEFGLVGSGYVYPKDKNKQISEIVGEYISLVVVDVGDKKSKEVLNE